MTGIAKQLNGNGALPFPAIRLYGVTSGPIPDTHTYEIREYLGNETKLVYRQVFATGVPVDWIWADMELRFRRYLDEEWTP